MTPADFIQKWKDNKLSERAGAQAHSLDLCELPGVEKASDPGEYCFERGAKRIGSDLHTFVLTDIGTPESWTDCTSDMPDEEILRRLLKLNLKRAAANR